MPIQLSNCCKAPIDFNEKLDRPECFTCIECGRIIGTTHNKESGVEDSNIIENNGEYYIKCTAHEEVVGRNIEKAKEEGRQEERNRVAKILLKDNCFKCGKEVPKPEDSPKDRKRWVDKCEGCKK